MKKNFYDLVEEIQKQFNQMTDEQFDRALAASERLTEADVLEHLKESLWRWMLSECTILVLSNPFEATITYQPGEEETLVRFAPNNHISAFGAPGDVITGLCNLTFKALGGWQKPFMAHLTITSDCLRNFTCRLIRLTENGRDINSLTAGLRVTMPDGSVIAEEDSLKTFIRVMKLIGIPNVKAATPDLFATVPSSETVEVEGEQLIVGHSTTAVARSIEKIGEKIGVKILAEVIGPDLFLGPTVSQSQVSIGCRFGKQISWVDVIAEAESKRLKSVKIRNEIRQRGALNHIESPRKIRLAGRYDEEKKKLGRKLTDEERLQIIAQFNEEEQQRHKKELKEKEEQYREADKTMIKNLAEEAARQLLNEHQDEEAILARGREPLDREARSIALMKLFKKPEPIK